MGSSSRDDKAASKIFVNCFLLQYPDSQEKKGMGSSSRDDKAASKIFVGRVTENLTKEDLMDHFNNFGQVTDVYIPNPFRHFAFVQVTFFSQKKFSMTLFSQKKFL